MRRKHFNATQKLRLFDQTNTDEEKARLEQEVLLCGSGKIQGIDGRCLLKVSLELVNLRKKYDLRSALQWREHVEQIRAKVKR